MLYVECAQRRGTRVEPARADYITSESTSQARATGVGTPQLYARNAFVRRLGRRCSTLQRRIRPHAREQLNMVIRLDSRNSAQYSCGIHPVRVSATVDESFNNILHSELFVDLCFLVVSLVRQR